MYYDPAASTFGVEQTNSGNQLIAYAEKVTNLQNADYDLLISGEDGNPNHLTGLLINDSAGWRFRTTPYDNVHGHMQYKFQNKFFASFGHFPGYRNSPESGPGIVVSNDNLESWEIVGDPTGEFSQINNRKSTTFHEIRGSLFSTGYYAGPNNFVTADWLTHYTGDAVDSFETVYETSGQFHSSLSGAIPYGIRETIDLNGNKGILLASNANAIRFRIEQTAGRNGTYPKPVGESVVSTNTRDLLTHNGTGYILEHSGSTAKVRWSYDLINWNTLFTCSIDYAQAIEIINGDVYLLSYTHLYKIPSSAFSNLPSNQNVGPIANPDNFQTEEAIPVSPIAGSKGILPNDTDGNLDKLTATLLTPPNHGSVTIQPNGRFTYTPDNNFQGQDSFTYTASDGLASSTAQVTLSVGPNSAPTDLQLDNSSVAAGQPIGTPVGRLTTTDQTQNDQFTYTLLGQSNSNFKITGDILQTNKVLNLQDAATYQIQIQTTDAAGNSFQKMFTINILDGSKLSPNGFVIFGDDAFGDADQDAENSTSSAVAISPDRRSATITGNAWKLFPINYTVTPDTILEFTAGSTDTGEILGIGLLDITDTTDTRRSYLIGGSQVDGSNHTSWSWTRDAAERLSPGDPPKSYSIPVGTDFTGEVKYLVLIGDDDAAPGSTSATFSNIRIHNGTNPSSYQKWKEMIQWGSINPALQEPDQDPDQDGINNATERAFGTDPRKPGPAYSGKFEVSQNPQSNASLKIKYLKGAPEKNYILQQTNDLQSWTDVVSSVEQFDLSTGDYFHEWTPTNNPRSKFIRIKVSP